MKNLNNYTTKELEKMMVDIENEISNRKNNKKIYNFSLSTIDNFDKRKNGGSYVARITKINNKIEREFISNNGLLWSSNRKYYKTSYDFTASDGDIFEVRLDDGSWKNDYREYYKIENGELVSIEKDEIL